MKVVWKFELTEGVLNVPLRTPENSGDVKHVGFDPRGVRCVWIEVDDDLKREVRAFVHIGTGHPIPDRSTYRGTYLDGSLVLHVYEIDPRDL